MSYFNIRNNSVPPSINMPHSHEASTSAARTGSNSSAPPRTPNIQDATHSALLRFGTHARARAEQLRGQLIGNSGVAFESYKARVEDALTKAMDARMLSASIDQQAELRNICIAKLNEIYRFATEQNGQLVDSLLTLPGIPLHDRTPSVERADQMAAAILKSDLNFLKENMNLWIEDTAIDQQVRDQCLRLISRQHERE